ncbi:MAG: hypothetical protein PSV35_00515 [bacterium]|nr:hypothetical protein [bacterium]
MVGALSELLKYKNPDVLHRYRIDYASNKLKAEDAFAELLKFLWLSQKHENEKAQYSENKELDFVFGIRKEIDDMWHIFLLFTQDYADFCQTYFAKFIHHRPTHESERLSVNEDNICFKRYFNYVKTNMDENTVSLWF